MHGERRSSSCPSFITYSRIIEYLNSTVQIRIVLFSRVEGWTSYLCFVFAFGIEHATTYLAGFSVPLFASAQEKSEFWEESAHLWWLRNLDENLPKVDNETTLAFCPSKIMKPREEDEQKMYTQCTRVHRPSISSSQTLLYKIMSVHKKTT